MLASSKMPCFNCITAGVRTESDLLGQVFLKMGRFFIRCEHAWEDRLSDARRAGENRPGRETTRRQPRESAQVIHPPMPGVCHPRCRASQDCDLESFSQPMDFSGYRKIAHMSDSKSMCVRVRPTDRIVFVGRAGVCPLPRRMVRQAKLKYIESILRPRSTREARPWPGTRNPSDSGTVRVRCLDPRSRNGSSHQRPKNLRAIDRAK